jgi:hypothetical protein
MKVNIEIGELVLYGFESRKVNTVKLAKVIESELTSLMASSALPPDARSQKYEQKMVDGGVVNLSHDQADSRSLGRGIARSIYNSSLGII